MPLPISVAEGPVPVELTYLQETSQRPWIETLNLETPRLNIPISALAPEGKPPTGRARVPVQFYWRDLCPDHAYPNPAAQGRPAYPLPAFDSDRGGEPPGVDPDDTGLPTLAVVSGLLIAGDLWRRTFRFWSSRGFRPPSGPSPKLAFILGLRGRRECLNNPSRSTSGHLGPKGKTRNSWPLSVVWLWSRCTSWRTITRPRDRCGKSRRPLFR